MAVTTINLSDPVSTWVSKTNIIATNVGDLSLMSIGGSNIVVAVNRLDSNIGTISNLTTIDKSDLVNAINETYNLAVRGNEALNDSDEIIGLFSSSTTISLDSASGQFGVINNSITFDQLASNTIQSSNLSSKTTLQIKNAAGSVVKTMYSPGN